MSKIESPESPTVRFVTGVERASSLAIHIGRSGIVLITPLFFGYVLLGTALTWTSLATFPYPFLSVAADPVFNLLGFGAGTALAFASSGLFVLLLLNDLERVGNQLAMILIGISIGSSAALLRHTHETALSAIVTALRMALEFSGII